MPIFLNIVRFRLVTLHTFRPHSQASSSNLLQVLNSMPKDPKHILESQKQRKKIKERISKYVPGKVTLQVLGTGAKGAPRALYVFTDQSRYLFNCGEGTQRLAHEHKMKLSKLEHIFVTQPVWRNIGGLPGLALTVQDVGVPEITLHGPSGLNEMFFATKRFVVIRDLKIHMAECNETTVFEDNVMSVRYVPLNRSENTKEEKADCTDTTFKDLEVNATVDHSDACTSTKSSRSSRRRRNSSNRSNSSSEEVMEDDTDYYAHEHSGSGINQNNLSETAQQVLEEIKDKGISMAYICKLHPRPGALNLEKCVKMGVPPGPLLGKIKGGEDITLPNGTVVTSKDVCEPDDPGPVFIVVDCPSPDYIESLINNEAFKKHQMYAERDEDVAHLVVHFSSKEVISDERYKKWRDAFLPSTQHLVLNEYNTCMGSQAVHRIQYKLNLLTEELFPLLGDDGMHVEQMVTNVHLSKKLKCDDSSEKTLMNIDQNEISMKNLSVQSRPNSPSDLYIFPHTFCNIHLRPKKGLDRSMELKLNPSEYINETMVLDDFPNTLQNLKRDLLQRRNSFTIEEFPKILFLGTGSCIPNKTRNTSGILLRTSDTHSILLDCGEGTCGQIVRFFGIKQSEHILAGINAVYISHLHADHHIGLVGFLQGRRIAREKLNLNSEPVYLFAPVQIMAWLKFYDRFFESICDEFILVPNGELLCNNFTYPASILTAILEQLGMTDIKTCYVRHCPNAFGVSFTDKNGRKLTYSGDTMPATSLIELGMNSDVLIHEATMEDELAGEAIVKMHSTTSQAIDVGKKMKAKYVLLTHFSQRYAKLPRFNDNFAENVGIAFDNMQVSIDELPLVPCLYPALRCMFAEHYEELEHKAVKRQLKLERERSASNSRRSSVS